MLSVRRAALLVKLHGPFLESSRVISESGGAGTGYLKRLLCGRCGVLNYLHYTLSAVERLFVGNCGFCSQAGAGKEHEHDKVEPGFSKFAGRLEKPNVVEGYRKELLSKLELSDDDDNVAGNEDLEKINTALELLKSIIRAPNDGIWDLLKKWVEEGNKLSKKGFFVIIDCLRRRRMNWRALQLSEWLETSNLIDLSEDYYALCIDCISNVQDLKAVERFFDKIPKSFKGELAYRSLLSSCVYTLNMRKAEAVFEKMRELDLPTTVEACNQMIILYKRLDRKRIAGILSMMEAQNVKPSLLTYKLLIDSKGSSKDILGMEHVIESMKADGIEPDINLLAVMAQHYIAEGFGHKAETVLKKIEERRHNGIWETRRLLLTLYASIGRDDKVGEIWRDCELEPTIEEGVAAIAAWGKLGKIEEAEAIFDMMHQKQGFTARLCSSLLEIYVDNKLLTKGKDLVKRMFDDGCWISPLTSDLLVRLYIEAGEIERADEFLQKASSWKNTRPLFRTLLAVMEQYAERGDIHNTEKLYRRIQMCRYTGRLKPFEVLIQAYIKAKTPAYGFLDRMRAEKVFPNWRLGEQLAQVDPFRKNALADILD